MNQITILDPTDLDQVRRCFPIFAVLRPNLDEAEFVARVRRQTGETYRIAYVDIGERVAAAAGFRVAHFLWAGKTLYVDDLITDPTLTRRGLGGALLDWLIAEGKRLSCDEIHLDTGYQRHDAHRLYLNKGFDISCHHLAMSLR